MESLNELINGLAKRCRARLKRKRTPLLLNWKRLRTAESTIKELLEAEFIMCPICKHSLHNHFFRVICSYRSWDESTHNEIIDRIKSEGPDALVYLREWKRPLTGVVVFALKDRNDELGIVSVLFDMSFLAEIALLHAENLSGPSRSLLMSWAEQNGSHWVEVEPIPSEEADLG